MIDLGNRALRHRPQVGSAMLHSVKDRDASGIAHYVIELAEFVGRVDRHQWCSSERGGLLQDQPFRAVGRPYADAGTRSEILHQDTCAAFGAVEEPSVGPGSVGAWSAVD